MSTKVAVAMSGGVDSSVAAAFMHKKGYKVVGITLHLHDGEDFITDSKLVANKIGFDHHVVDLRTVFRDKIIKKFKESYFEGSTPIPCISCNKEVKFNELLKKAKELGCEKLITGHYVKCVNKNELHIADNKVRDQSYFLFELPKKDLKYYDFPLGYFPDKEYTKKLAEEFGIKEIAKKSCSNDLCFIPDGDYKKFISKFQKSEPGEIVDINGKVLGKHDGIIGYTIGQRKGIRISSDKPLYVIKILKDKNQIVVGNKDLLETMSINLRNINMFVEKKSFACNLKIRSCGNFIKGKVFLNDDNTGKVTFDYPEYGVAKGQACVFYDNTRVLGGGWIC